MAGKFELKQAKNGEFHFNLQAANGQIILTSELYKTKASAQNGIESVMKNAANTERYEKLVSTNGKFYFVLKAANHQIIGQSQLYADESARDKGIESVQHNAPEAETIDLTV